MYSVRQLAEDHDLPVTYSQSICTKQGWYIKLASEREKLHEAILTKQRDQFAIDEVEIRIRQQRQAKKVCEIAETAMDRLLEAVSEADNGATILAPRDIATFLRVGLEQERKAMGLPDEFKISDDTSDENERFGKTPIERARAAKELRVMAAEILEYRRKHAPNGSG